MWRLRKGTSIHPCTSGASDFCSWSPAVLSDWKYQWGKVYGYESYLQKYKKHSYQKKYSSMISRMLVHKFHSRMMYKWKQMFHRNNIRKTAISQSSMNCHGWFAEFIKSFKNKKNGKISYNYSIEYKNQKFITPSLWIKS